MSRFRRHALVLCALAGFAGAASGQGVHPLDDIRATAEAYVRDRIPKTRAHIRVQAGTLDSRLRLVPCSTPLQASLPSGARIAARTTVAVSCESTPTWTVYVPVSVESQIPVLVLNRAATRGQRITAQDVEVQTRTVSGTAEDYLTDVSELAGRTVKRPLPAGTALTADVMVEDLLVHRGQQVTLLAKLGGIEVRAVGKALNDARAAGRVRVQNLSSHEVVEGIVDGPGVIRVSP